MDFRTQIHRRWFRNMAISLAFGLFIANARGGGLFPPTITAQPSSTYVQNGDTATFTMSANCLLSAISGVTWYCNGRQVTAPNATVGYGGLLGLTSISSTLTITQASSTNAGSYYAVVENLLGGTAQTTSATLGILAPVTAVPSASGMVSKGFKFQFSGPVGSNVVIEATSDLVNWHPLSTNVLVGGSVTCTDAVAKTVSCRFYRARLK